MVQITQSNLLQGTESGSLMPSGIIPGQAGLQAASDVQGAVDRAVGILGKISQTAEDMEVNKRLTDAQVEFSRGYDERSNQLELEDGTPAHDTLDRDLTKMGRDITNAYADGIVGSKGRDKFNLLMGNFVANKRIQGFGVARKQKIERATGDFFGSLDNLTKQASTPSNADLAPSFIKQADELIGNAVSNQLITSTQGKAFSKSFSEGTHESLLRQSIDGDPLSALALLDNDSVDVGVEANTRLMLKKLAKTTLNVRRANASTIATQRTNASKASMEFIELNAKDMIDGSPIDGMEGGFSMRDLETINTTIDDLAVIHTDDQIANEADPVVQASMRADNVTAFQYAQKRKAEVRNSYEARNKTARDEADRDARIKKDLKNGLSISEKDAQFSYRRESAGQDMGVKRQNAEKYNQPQPALQNEMVMAVASGNVQALADSVGPDGETVPGVLSTFARLQDTSPRVLKGLSETDTSKLTYLTALVGTGTPLKDAVGIIKEQFDTINSARRDGFRSEFRKNDDNGKNLRDYILERAINKIGGITSGVSDASPQFLNAATTLAELQYQIHGNKDVAADTVALLMQDAGETDFPIKSQGFFSNDQEIMIATPEKVMGWSPREAKVAVSKFKQEFSTSAKVNGIESDTLYIEADGATVRPGRPHTWAVYGVTDNGTHVSLGRYQPSTKKELVEHDLQQSYAVKKEENRKINKVRKLFGLEGKALPSASEVQTKARAKVKKMKESARRNVIKSRVDAVAGGNREASFNNTTLNGPTLPDIASVFVRDAQTAGSEIAAGFKDIGDFIMNWEDRVWNTVVPKTLTYLNEYFIEPHITGPQGDNPAPKREIQGPSFEKTMEQYGSVVINEPAKAEEMFTDAQFEDYEDEVSIDVGFNVTGLDQETVSDRQDARLMEDTRALTAASDPVFKNALEEAEFNATMELLHESSSAPDQVLPHQAAMDYLKTKKTSEMSGAEKQYKDRAGVREEKFQSPTPPSDKLIPEEVMKKIQSDPLLDRVYQSETYRARAYRDGSKDNPNHKDGFITIGIGWNIEPGDNDTKNKTMVHWLNTVTGKTYDLDNLVDGRQTLSPQDAVTVLQRQVRGAGAEAGQLFGRGYNNLSTAQTRIITDMSFQLGINGLKKFRSLISNIKKGDMLSAPLEIIDSTAGTQQTPKRFAHHFVSFINGGGYNQKERTDLKAKAIAFYKKKKITNVSGTNQTADVIDIITNGIK